MKTLCLLLAFSCSLVRGNKNMRHYFGPNGTVPHTLVNMGTVNVAG